MWRDRWLAVGVLGSLLACLACATSLAVVVLAAVGLGAWTRSIDVGLVAALAGFVILALYRLAIIRKRRARPPAGDRSRA